MKVCSKSYVYILSGFDVGQCRFREEIEGIAVFLRVNDFFFHYLGAKTIDFEARIVEYDKTCLVGEKAYIPFSKAKKNLFA